MTEPTTTPTFKPKKSVALSGVPAGNTALCTVGRNGNDLHYRGYDILDLAARCEFEEVAYLLLYGHLPNAQKLAMYKQRLRSLRGLPPQVKLTLEQLPPTAHPMDVLRVGVSVLATLEPEPTLENLTHAPETGLPIADRLMASLGSMLLYWYHFSTTGKQIEVQTDDDSIASHFLTLLHGKKQSEEWIHAMQVSLILYAEHEFNASTFTARVIAGTGSDLHSCHRRSHRRPQRPQARRRQRSRPRNPAALRERPMRQRPTSASASRTRKSSSASATPSTPSAIPRNAVIKKSRVQISAETAGDTKHLRTSPTASKPSCMDSQKNVSQPRLVFSAVCVSHVMGIPTAMFTPHLRDSPHQRLVRPRHRAAPSTAKSSAPPLTTPGRTIWLLCRSKNALRTPCHHFCLHGVVYEKQ